MTIRANFVVKNNSRVAFWRSILIWRTSSPFWLNPTALLKIRWVFAKLRNFDFVFYLHFWWQRLMFWAMDSLNIRFCTVNIERETKNVLIRKKILYINVRYCIWRCVFAHAQPTVLSKVQYSNASFRNSILWLNCCKIRACKIEKFSFNKCGFLKCCWKVKMSQGRQGQPHWTVMNLLRDLIVK